MDHLPLPSEIDKENYIFYSPTSADENSIKQKGGQWHLFAPKNVKKLDDWWPVLRKLCDDGTLIAIKSSTATDPVECIIVCYTSDFENEKEVKEAADKIRKLTNYQYTMYYKARKSIAGLKPDLVYLYEHTVTGEFYKKERVFLLPSEIYWKDHFYYFGKQTSGNTEDMKQKSGKWTLYAFGDTDKVDQRFLVMQNLCDNGTLTSFSTTTCATEPMKAMTICFTKDFKNAKEVKKAADEIRKLIDYEYVMYYSPSVKHTPATDVVFTNEENYNYMHTVKGGFYKKDKYMRWTSLPT